MGNKLKNDFINKNLKSTNDTKGGFTKALTTRVVEKSYKDGSRY